MIIQRQTFLEIARYGFVGLAQNGVSYLIYIIATWLGAEPKLTVAVLYPIAATISYIGNKQWSFDYKGDYLSSFKRFIIAHIISYLINLSLLYYFVDQLQYPHQIVQLIAIFICAGFLFLALKFFVFHGPTRNDKL